MTRIRSFSAVAVCGALLAAACTQKPSPTYDVSFIQLSREQLSVDLDECTRLHKYDPEQADQLGEYEIGDGELEWRQCAYAALRKHSRSVPDMQTRYEDVIAADLEMTRQIQDGTLSRSERRIRTKEMMDQIATAEDIRIETEDQERARQEQLRNLTDNFQQSLR